jgi:hypothetical protein
VDFVIQWIYPTGTCLRYLADLKEMEPGGYRCRKCGHEKKLQKPPTLCSPVHRCRYDGVGHGGHPYCRSAGLGGKGHWRYFPPRTRPQAIRASQASQVLELRQQPVGCPEMLAALQRRHKRPMRRCGPGLTYCGTIPKIGSSVYQSAVAPVTVLAAGQVLQQQKKSAAKCKHQIMGSSTFFFVGNG